MGCLFFLIETIFDGIIEGWFTLMQWIIPEKFFGRGIRIALKLFVGLFTIVLFLCMILGLIAAASDDPDTKVLGKYMLFIPLGISAVQSILGIVVKRFSKKK